MPDDSPALSTWGGMMDLLGCTLEDPTVIPAERVWSGVIPREDGTTGYAVGTIQIGEPLTPYTASPEPLPEIPDDDPR